MGALASAFEEGVVGHRQDGVGIPAVDVHGEGLGELGLLDLAGDADAALAGDVHGLQGQVGGGLEGLAAEVADPLQPGTASSRKRAGSLPGSS